MARVLLVSNRLPITLQRDDDGSQRIEASSGGLVAGLAPLHEDSEGVWIGHSGLAPDDRTAAELRRRRLVPVTIPDEDYDAYYNGYSNAALWPLFHYLLERSEFEPERFAAYRRVNERFAETVLEQALPGDLIWVHDYQLMLLPELIRRELPDARIGFFLHIPFPSSEIFRVLPEREEILRGVLGADLIGTHTFEYADHFARSVRRVLGFEAGGGQIRVGTRVVHVEAHPLGIDVAGLRERAFSEEADRRLATHRQWVGDRQIVLGVDRLDYTKGLPLKLAAFRRLLERSPRWREEAVFVQLAVPSRQDIADYQAQRAEVEQLVGQINGLYGRPGRVPVQYMYRSVEPEELGALYRLANVAYVAPLRDGLNLVAKEYVACHGDGTGALVVSEFAGVASELGEAIRINPWDVEGTARQLERALEMTGEEQSQRMSAMHARVRAGDVHRWVARFMRSLEEPGTGAGTAPPMLSARTLAESLADGFSRAGRALLVLDYGGSLRELAPSFDLAVPTEEVLSVLRELSALPGVEVVVQSGRDRDRLDEWFQDLPLSLVAEHGTWLRARGTRSWERIGPPPDESWKADARSVLEEYASRAPGSRIEERSASMVWHYGGVDGDQDEWLVLELVSVLETLLSDAPAEVRRGARMLEIRQRGVSKANAYEHVLSVAGPFDFQLIAGDDRTDDELFRAAGSAAVTLRVGAGQSIADAAVGSPRGLRELLTSLARARSSIGEGPSRPS